MRILGTRDHVSCGSALVDDGKLLTAITDECLVTEKIVFGIPIKSVKIILEMLGLNPGDIDGITIATTNRHLIDAYFDFKDGWFCLKQGKFKQALFEVASNVSKLRKKLPTLGGIYYGMRQPAFRKRRTD